MNPEVLSLLWRALAALFFLLLFAGIVGGILALVDYFFEGKLDEGIPEAPRDATGREL